LATLVPKINGWDVTTPILHNCVPAPHFGVPTHKNLVANRCPTD